MDKVIFAHNGKEYSFKNIVSVLKDVGIVSGDSIFVHADLRSFGKVCESVTREEYIGCFVDALRQVVGEKGNIIVPTFSYSFCKNEVFDLVNTPSAVGILTNYVLKIPGVKRSGDAIFSVVVLGPDQDYLTDVGIDCFGAGSIFEKMYNKNVKIVFLGETFDMTYMHFIEQACNVPYRFIKEFKGQVKIGNELKDASLSYFVRSLERNVDYDLEGMADWLNDKGVLRKENLGNSKVRLVNAVDAFNVIRDGFKDNVEFLLKAEKDDNAAH